MFLTSAEVHRFPNAQKYLLGSYASAPQHVTAQGPSAHGCGRIGCRCTVPSPAFPQRPLRLRFHFSCGTAKNPRKPRTGTVAKNEAIRSFKISAIRHRALGLRLSAAEAAGAGVNGAGGGRTGGAGHVVVFFPTWVCFRRCGGCICAGPPPKKPQKTPNLNKQNQTKNPKAKIRAAPLLPQTRGWVVCSRVRPPPLPPPRAPGSRAR